MCSLGDASQACMEQSPPMTLTTSTVCRVMQRLHIDLQQERAVNQDRTKRLIFGQWIALKKLPKISPNPHFCWPLVVFFFLSCVSPSSVYQSGRTQYKKSQRGFVKVFLCIIVPLRTNSLKKCEEWLWMELERRKAKWPNGTNGCIYVFRSCFLTLIIWGSMQLFRQKTWLSGNTSRKLLSWPFLSCLVKWKHQNRKSAAAFWDERDASS